MNEQPGWEDTSRYKAIIQIAIIGVSGLWLVFLVIQEINQLIYNSLAKSPANEAFFGTYAFTILLSFMGIVLPLLLILLLYRNISRRLKHNKRKLPFHKELAIELHGNAGILLCVIILFIPVYVIAELYFPFSVVPLNTPICGLIGAIIGYWMLRQMKTRDRLTVMALLLALILAAKYIDWNPKKPLARDMFRIKAGMTVAEVENIMAEYKNGPGYLINDDLDDESREENELVYMTPYSADMVTVKFRDGKVETVEFLPD